MTNDWMRCVVCEECPDLADVVKGKSAGLGHSGAGESVVEDYARFLAVSEGDIVMSSTVTDRSMVLSLG